MDRTHAVLCFVQRLALVAVVVGAVLAVHSVSTLGQRGVLFYTDYPSVIVSQGKDVSLDVEIINTGLRTEEVLLAASAPEGWDSHFETTSYPTLKIKAVSLRPGQDEEEAVKIRFKASAEDDTAPGEYSFTLLADSSDAAIHQEILLSVTVVGEEEMEEPVEGGLELSINYPSLENPAGEAMEYEVQMKSLYEDDKVVELGANVPPGWGAYFSPRYESQRISSIRVSGGTSDTVKFAVTPPYGTEEGEYAIEFSARVDEVEEILDLKAVVTGTTELNLGTEAEITGKGDTRNIKATEGKERRFTLYLWNTGSAAMNDVSLYASKPEGWEVTFDPEKLDAIPPLAESRKPESVDAIITPISRAIPGDYQVTLTAAASDDREQIAVRVTVGSSMGWGWIGVGIVVFVVAGLTGIFVRLGRR